MVDPISRLPYIIHNSISFLPGVYVPIKPAPLPTKTLPFK